VNVWQIAISIRNIIDTMDAVKRAEQKTNKVRRRVYFVGWPYFVKRRFALLYAGLGRKEGLRSVQKLGGELESPPPMPA
jgi:hypothetical protein